MLKSDRTGDGRFEAYQIHAFTEAVHSGNPAGVCLLKTWLEDERLAAIAKDLGPSVTAFVLAGDSSQYPLRWFARTGREVNSFCGHATFSAAHVLLRIKGVQYDPLSFLTVTGERQVRTAGEDICMTVPNWGMHKCACPETLLRSIGHTPTECLQGPRDYLLVFDSVAEVEGLRPDFDAMRSLGDHGIIATARRSATEIVHRFFCPGFSINMNEDPATGSAFSTLVPYWSHQLGIARFSASQLSARGGTFRCSMDDGVATLYARCATFFSGSITA